jgi:hypothetical protein
MKTPGALNVVLGEAATLKILKNGEYLHLDI